MNRSRQVVQGIPAVPHIEDLPSEVDLAIIAVPAAEVVDAVKACGKVGVANAVVFSAGFSEVGPEGQTREISLVTAARQGGVRLLGPNSLGFFHTASGTIATFSSAPESAVGLLPGDAAFITQSGAFGTYIHAAAQLRGFGFSYFVAVGNESDLDVADFIEAVAADESVGVIAGYLEMVRDGERFVRAVESARAVGKSVGFMKVGRSDRARLAAVSHTGAMTGRHAVYEAVFQRTGVVLLDSFADAIEFMQAASRTVTMRPTPGVAVVSLSGGVGVWMADRLTVMGITLAELAAQTQRSLQERLPAFGSALNPVDLTAQVINDTHLVGGAIDDLLGDPGVDMLVIALGLLNDVGEEIARLLVSAAERTDKLIYVAWIAMPDGVDRLIRASRAILFDDFDTCLVAVAQAVRSSQARHRPQIPVGASLRAAKTTFTDRQVLTESESKVLLAEHGLPVTRNVLVKGSQACIDAAAEIGYPVVVKTGAAGIAHKSDRGLVRVALKNASDVLTACQDLQRISSSELFLVEEMVDPGVEALVSFVVDATFGPMITVGVGGQLVELIKDVAMAPCPVTQSLALELIGSTALGHLLRGVRGRPAANAASLADVIVRISQIAESRIANLVELELNPVIVTHDRAIVVDALAVRAAAQV